MGGVEILETYEREPGQAEGPYTESVKGTFSRVL